jgi:hypothetical protein
LALVFSIGGGAGYAASIAHSPTKITSHWLHLINNWTTDGTSTGHPSYAVSGGVVYVSGGMHQTTGSKREFAFLPKAARPTHTLWIGVFSEAAMGGAFLEVTPAGAMFISGPDAQFFSSLSGVSFPVGS